MDKEIIINRLKEHWNYAKHYGYNEKNFLGIFLYGSQNYGFGDINSDVDSIIIYLPSFEDFCLKSTVESKELIYDNNEHINIKDIRLIREMFLKQNINFIEILYTEYFILNPKYEDLFKTYFINNRENISHYDVNKTIKSICGQAIHTLRQDPSDRKKIYNAQRLYHFLKSYKAGMPYIDCIQPKGQEFRMLWSIKFGNEKLDFNPNILESQLRTLGSEEMVQNVEQKRDAIFALNEGVIRILKFFFAEVEEALPQENVSKKTFLNQLTNIEEKAYYSIIKEIGAEGNVSISKLVEKNTISRPVYNNLMNKLKENKVAQVVNMGVKGTYLNITEPELRIEAINFK